MGTAASSLSDALVGAAVWATAPSSAARPTRLQRARDSPCTYDDVLDVLHILTHQARLPTELALQIVDAAQYWPAFACSWTGDTSVSAGVHGRRTVQTRLVTPPVPCIDGAPEQLLRRVSVWTDSRDQGYSSFPQHHGTREASSSWFELVLLWPRPPSPPLSSPPAELELEDDNDVLPTTLTIEGTPYTPHRTVRLHSNLHSSSSFAAFTTVLSLLPGECTHTPASYDADEARAFLGEARSGDRFAVLVCAQYPQWVNRVRACAIKVEVAAV